MGVKGSESRMRAQDVTPQHSEGVVSTEPREGTACSFSELELSLSAPLCPLCLFCHGPCCYRLIIPPRHCQTPSSSRQAPVHEVFGEKGPRERTAVLPPALPCLPQPPLPTRHWLRPQTPSGAVVVVSPCGYLLGDGVLEPDPELGACRGAQGRLPPALCAPEALRQGEVQLPHALRRHQLPQRLREEPVVRDCAQRQCRPAQPGLLASSSPACLRHCGLACLRHRGSSCLSHRSLVCLRHRGSSCLCHHGQSCLHHHG